MTRRKNIVFHKMDWSLHASLGVQLELHNFVHTINTPHFQLRNTLPTVCILQTIPNYLFAFLPFCLSVPPQNLFGYYSLFFKPHHHHHSTHLQSPTNISVQTSVGTDEVGAYTPPLNNYIYKHFNTPKLKKYL